MHNAKSDLLCDNNWVNRGNRLIKSYIGPYHKEIFNKNIIYRILMKYRVLALMWNYDFDYASEGEWYRCICDNKKYDELCITSSNIRHNLHRSLKRCNVKHISLDWLSENGYDTYKNAASRYTNFKVDNIKRFKEKINKRKRFNQIAYGAFVDNNLAAYAIVIITGKSMFGDEAYFDPRYSNAYPMYALYYTIAKEAMLNGYSEFDRGTRPILHETNIDEFLVRLGYRISYCRLGVYYSFPLKITMRFLNAYPKLKDRLLVPKLSLAIDRLTLAQEIAKNTKSQ